MCSDAAAESFATHPYSADVLYKISLAYILQYGRSVDPMKLTIKEKIPVPRALQAEQVMNVMFNASRAAYAPKSKEAGTNERVDRAARGARSAALVALLLSKTKSPDAALDLYERFTYL